MSVVAVEFVAVYVSLSLYIHMCIWSHPSPTPPPRNVLSKIKNAYFSRKTHIDHFWRKNHRGSSEILHFHDFDAQTWIGVCTGEEEEDELTISTPSPLILNVEWVLHRGGGGGAGEGGGARSKSK